MDGTKWKVTEGNCIVDDRKAQVVSLNLDVVEVKVPGRMRQVMQTNSMQFYVDSLCFQI